MPVFPGEVLSIRGGAMGVRVRYVTGLALRSPFPGGHAWGCVCLCRRAPQVPVSGVSDWRECVVHACDAEPRCLVSVGRVVPCAVSLARTAGASTIEPNTGTLLRALVVTMQRREWWDARSCGCCAGFGVVDKSLGESNLKVKKIPSIVNAAQVLVFAQVFELQVTVCG